MMEKKNKITIHSGAAEYLTYVAAVGDDERSYEMRYQDENVWLTQKMMAALYDVSVVSINEHIAKVYADGELTEASTIRKFRIVQTEGSREISRETLHYNLQMIIAVGFKVNNVSKTEFLKVISTDLLHWNNHLMRLTCQPTGIKGVTANETPVQASTISGRSSHYYPEFWIYVS